MSKKIYFAMLAILLAVPSVAFSAGSWTTPTSSSFDQVSSASPFRAVTLAWTGDAADGTVPLYDISKASTSGGGITVFDFAKGWYVYKVETNPGAVAPTDNYDIEFLSSGGADICKGKLLNRDETNTEVSGAINAPVDNGFSISITNQSVNSATGTIKIILAR